MFLEYAVSVHVPELEDDEDLVIFEEVLCIDAAGNELRVLEVLLAEEVELVERVLHFVVLEAQGTSVY